MHIAMKERQNPSLRDHICEWDWEGRDSGRVGRLSERLGGGKVMWAEGGGEGGGGMSLVWGAKSTRRFWGCEGSI